MSVLSVLSVLRYCNCFIASCVINLMFEGVLGQRYLLYIVTAVNSVFRCWPRRDSDEQRLTGRES